MTQTELAALLDTGQSRVAKMEAADSSVSTELLIRSLFSLGYTTQRYWISPDS
ncbi:MAG: helix-turn-helix transcriptional regulator [Chloroflexota bacterium]